MPKSIDLDSLRANNLPTGKVDRICEYGRLKYPSTTFYHFVCIIKHFFLNILIDENFLINGPSINSMMTSGMHNKPILLDCVSGILTEQTPNVIITDVLKYVLQTYSRMREKDLVRRILGKKSGSLNLHTQQKVTTTSDSFRFKFKKGLDKETDKEDISDHVQLQETLARI